MINGVLVLELNLKALRTTSIICRYKKTSVVFLFWFFLFSVLLCFYFLFLHSFTCTHIASVLSCLTLLLNGHVENYRFRESEYFCCLVYTDKLVDNLTFSVLYHKETSSEWKTDWLTTWLCRKSLAHMQLHSNKYSRVTEILDSESARCHRATPHI